jgi:ribosome-associated protein
MIRRMLQVTPEISIPAREIRCRYVRSQGAGGQNVNKVASAVHLRFDIHASSLPDTIKQRLLASADQRISADGVVVIKAQNHRTRERNRSEALERLAQMIASAARVRRRRIATAPTRASEARRLQTKKRRGDLKRQRRGGDDD